MHLSGCMLGWLAGSLCVSKSCFGTSHTSHLPQDMAAQRHPQYAWAHRSSLLCMATRKLRAPAPVILTVILQHATV
jgi:hypothetical protein